MGLLSNIFRLNKHSEGKNIKSMNLSEIIKQAKVDSPLPIGIINLGNEFEEPGPHFVIIFKVEEEDYINLLSATNIEPILTFIPTEYYPNLWFRLQITYGNKELGVPISYITCEYHLSILSQYHIQILDDMSKAEKFTLLVCNDVQSKISPWHFNITPDAKSNINIEIEACKNGISLYQNLDDKKFINGIHEIENSRKVSGEIINNELVSKQSSKRLHVTPFPHPEYIDIVFK